MFMTVVIGIIAFSSALAYQATAWTRVHRFERLSMALTALAGFTLAVAALTSKTLWHPALGPLAAALLASGVVFDIAAVVAKARVSK